MAKTHILSLADCSISANQDDQIDKIRTVMEVFMSLQLRFEYSSTKQCFDSSKALRSMRSFGQENLGVLKPGFEPGAAEREAQTILLSYATPTHPKSCHDFTITLIFSHLSAKFP